MSSILWRMITACLLICIKSQIVHASLRHHGHHHARASSIPISMEPNRVCENWSNAIEALTAECTWYNHTVQCYGGISNLRMMTAHRLRRTEQVIFCGWPNATFDSSILKLFPKMKILRIENSNLTHIDKDFPHLMHLQRINISWTNFGYARPTLFSNLPTLELVDLRWNKLQHMDGPFMLPSGFTHLYLAENPWDCSKSIKWLLNPSKAKRIADRDSLLCMDKRFAGRPVMPVMHYKLGLRDICHNSPELKNCTCHLSYVLPEDENGSVKPMYSINCSHLGLERLPSFVPENTTIFYAMHNRISSVEPLQTTYHSVHDIFLDYNEIESIDALASEGWLEHFRVFSLRGNQLTKLPVYVLNNALERNRQVATLYLSENPWRCECVFTVRFQDLLQKYHTIINDASNVTCKYIEGDDNFGKSVLALKRGDVCKLPTEYRIRPLDLLNGVLASLIILIFSKLAYDYYHYRKSGRLPWIVTKMP